MTHLMRFNYNLRSGIRLRIHPLFTLLMFMSVVTGHYVEIVTLFSIVILHEAGHVAAAKYYDWRLREIQLTPFGGVVLADEEGSKPAKEEAIIALAGPVVNVLLVLLAYGLQWFGVWSDRWTQYFVEANLTLMVFNLLPILPLDGGRIVQAFISFKFPYFETIRSVAIWSMVSSGFLLGWACLGFGIQKFELNLVCISLFLLYANGHAWKQVPYRFIRFLISRPSRMADWHRKAVLPSPLVVQHDTPLFTVVRRIVKEMPHIIVVCNGKGSVVGMIHEQRCVQHYLEKEQHRAVSELFM